MRKLLATTLIVIFLTVSSNVAGAADNYLVGSVVNTSSVPAGLLIMLDGGTPTNCSINGAMGWMLIKEENKTMISLTLAMILSGKKAATVYTSGVGTSGVCEVTQYDPVE